jgi:hypothetical protein
MIRQVIIHYHIFKNSGSTIDSILKRNFQGNWLNFEGKNPWDTLDGKSILNYTYENTNVKVISSHHARLPVPESMDIKFFPLIFIRHPIDRVGSVYSFERRQPKNSPSLGAKIAQKNRFKEYVKWRLSEGNGCVIKNFQTVHLAGREKDMRIADANELDLRTVFDRLNKLPFIGIVEMFEESVSRMKAFLEPKFGAIDASFSIQNKSFERKSFLEERLEDIQIALGKKVYQELIQKNNLDMELYNYALKLVTSSKKVTL